MTLGQALHRDRNNLDVVRLMAALAVIYGHANAMVPDALQTQDFVARWITFDYSGSLAVKLFFFLSGLVVTNSLLEKQSLLQFSLARLFRIWPALLAVLLVMAYVVGPAVTSLPWQDYVRDPRVLGYVRDGLAMQIKFELPGVFAEHKTNAVNGSLWSIPYEVQAYFLLAALFALGVHRARWLAVLCFVWLCAEPLLAPRMFFPWRLPDADVDPLLPCFAAGALLALFKDRIQVTWLPTLGFLVLFFVFQKAVFVHYLFYGALFSGVVYVCTRPWMMELRLPADISYGVYLWGWPMQQLVAHWWPHWGTTPHRIAAVIGACICGVLSWYLLEKPGIDAGRRVYAWCLRWKGGGAVPSKGPIS